MSRSLYDSYDNIPDLSGVEFICKHMKWDREAERFRCEYREEYMARLEAEHQVRPLPHRRITKYTTAFRCPEQVKLDKLGVQEDAMCVKFRDATQNDCKDMQML